MENISNISIIFNQYLASDLKSTISGGNNARERRESLHQ